MFFKIITEEVGKEINTYYINIEQIKYIHYHDKNEAIPKSTIIPEAGDPYVEIFMGEGRRTFLFTVQDYDNRDTVEGEQI